MAITHAPHGVTIMVEAVNKTPRRPVVCEIALGIVGFHTISRAPKDSPVIILPKYTHICLRVAAYIGALISKFMCSDFSLCYFTHQ